MRIEEPQENQLLQMKQLWRSAFGEEEDFLEAFFSGAYAPARCRIATEGETVAAMLYWLDGECHGNRYAYLYAVATHPDFRGQGLCRALLADTRKELVCQGYAGALLYPAGEGLRGMYGKMGFRDCGEEREWSCTAGTPVRIWKVSKEAYAQLRRECLPEEGLLQEGAALDLLEKTAQLYAGEDFLLAASVEGKTLTAAELLGREAAAPGITAALGCQQGVFHRGKKAMFCPLRGDAPAPGYVGLVFD